MSSCEYNNPFCFNIFPKLIWYNILRFNPDQSLFNQQPDGFYRQEDGRRGNPIQQYNLMDEDILTVVPLVIMHYALGMWPRISSEDKYRQQAPKY
ncbi:hypothetical protein TNIN_333291 [Trichonephila inaurata madagascariensis]|uniref:Uncharacterized protein n=1 Tax=Trichonephila inaurata madagascariensis TaxID=2747483 RepID=A0A8X7CC25_9ARAC|nr:hypothetical protein TNIN_264611 [Trichonephila inaurata madagascariensis]GFY63843.1 hypothetical protein TNIN_333291 [Trichonephila inaurata madagascariensis]